jgi:hypothetical protein
LVLEHILLGLGRVPESSVIDGGDRQLLSHVFDPGGQSLNPLTRGGD